MSNVLKIAPSSPPPPQLPPLATQLFAEFLGTAGLLCAVIGSGIMAERLSGGNMGLALLANTLVTVFALYVLIETLGPISGAHFNPLVTLVIFSKTASNSHISSKKYTYLAILFIAFQLLGAILGAWLANAMFDLNVLQLSTKLRGGWTAAGQFTGFGQWLAEAVATAGLIVVILRSGAANVHAKASALVACYIGAAYWFTASTSFANPAAVMGRMFSDSFAGIAPVSAIGFIASQAIGALAGVYISHYLEHSQKSPTQNTL
ncbi:MIP/aquaporin family protein [Polaromonas sp.]|uniref:aquaporin n=1 Tax=Polaromonas sp. TaxID=1869339 RepID=UPI0027313569|nr:MIP/aquaporin family protein [Polaromonas sp.]MDP1887614.1 MIP/aquaporin family protein [Polaromonas sp.]